ncbi:MAG: SPOCS domain-containing protein [Eubacteriales bacterium]
MADKPSYAGMKIGEDHVTDMIYTDSTGEYTLPDYMPEIRRILSVTSKVLPSGQFIGSDRVEFAGNCVHTVIYTGGEGKLAAVSLQSDYEFSVPRKGCDPTETKASVISRPENVTVRLSGPRKVGIRTVVGSQVHVYCEAELRDGLSGLEGAGEIELLTKTVPCRLCVPLLSPDLHYTNSTKAEGGEGEVEILSGEGNVLVREARAVSGGAICRGEIWVRCLYTVGDGPPTVAQTKIPFEELLPADEVDGTFSAMGWGRCQQVDVSASADGAGGHTLTFDVTAVLEGQAATNQLLRTLADVYAAEYPVSVSRRQMQLAETLGHFMGNYTVDGGVSRSESDAEDAIAIISTTGTAEMDSVEHQGNKVQLTGQCKINMIVASAPDNAEGRPTYSAVNFHFPFKLQCDLPDALPPDAEFHAVLTFVSGRGRIDPARLSADCELALALEAYRQHRVGVVESAEADTEHPVEKAPGELVVVYLHDGESLWSVAKRYHARQSDIVALNKLPKSALENADAPYELDGFFKLLIER